MSSRTVVAFPEGGKDFYRQPSRLVAVTSVMAYVTVAGHRPDLIVRLERAMRLQKDKFCLIPEDLEQEVFSLIGT